MATTKPKEDPKPVEGEGAPKKSKKMLFIIIGVLVLLIGGGAGYYFLVMTKEAPSEDAVKKVAEPKAPIYVVLDPFTVNLSSGGQYLQMGLTLQMKNDNDGTRLKSYLPSVRSRILSIISSKTADEITTFEGKEALKAEIKASIQTPFVEGNIPPEINDVLITAFVIQ